MKFIRPFVLAMLVFSLGACTLAQQARERDATALAEFEQFAGEPIPRFHTFRELDRWRSFDDRTLAIWVGVNRAYLIKLRDPCLDLHRQMTIRVNGDNGFVDAQFGRIEFGNERCRIGEIREIDEKARKKARREAKGS